MRKNSPQSTQTLIQTTELLLPLQAQAQIIMRLNSEMQGILPESLRGVCRVANYAKQIMVIEVVSASYLTRLRYEQTKLLSTLRQRILPGLSSIQFRINPDLAGHKRRLPSPSASTFSSTRQLSEQSALLLEALASTAPPKLKARLMSLLAHRPKSTPTNK